MNGFYIPVVDVTDVQTVWTRLVLSFVHSLWIGAIVGVLALAAFWLLRAGNRRNTRYLMLVSALLATAASPVLVFVALAPETALMMFGSPDNRPPVEVPGRLILTRPLVDPAAQPPPPEDTAAEPIRLVDDDEKVYVVPEVVGPPYAGTGFTPVTREGGPANWRIAISSKVIVAIYLLIAGALMARLAIGIAGGTRLRRTSQLVTDGALLSALARHTQALGMRITPAIAHCARVAVPTVVGVVRPMILLPLSATTGMTPEQIEYLVLHELAHIRRYDHIVNLIQRLIEALMFYHPVVWLLSRQIRIEREHCCDDMVVRLGGDARHYAESLLAAAALAQGQRAPSAVPTLGATGKASHLRRRIARILGEPAPAVRLRHAGWLFVTLALLVGIAGITQLRAGETTSESAVMPALTPPRNARAPVNTEVKIEPSAEAIPEAVTAPEARSEAPPTPEQIEAEHPVVPPRVEQSESVPRRTESSEKAPPKTTVQPGFPAIVPEAIGQLQDKDWWLRKLAIQQLVDSGWKDAWTFIVPVLNDEDTRVQAAAAIALGELKEPKSVKHLVAALKEGTEVSDASAKALAHFDHAEVMPLVRLAAQDEDNGVRRGAVKALREVKSPEVPALIVELLAKVPMVPPGNPNVARRVTRQGPSAAFNKWNFSDALADELARTFASIETAIAAEAVQLAATHSDWNTRAALMKVLAQPLFRSGIFEEKEVTTEAAAFLNRPGIVDVQVRAMQDPQKDVRVWAAVGIGLGNWVLPGNPDMAKVRRNTLIAGLRDNNLQIAQTCATYLSVSGGSTTWNPASDEDAVAYAVASKNRDGLVALGQRAVPALAAAMQMDASFPLTGFQGSVAEPSVYADALAAIGGPGAVEPLIGILEPANDVTTRIACNALGSLGDARAVEPLIRVARTANSETQYAAINALAKLKDKRAADVFLAALNVPDEPSRSSIRVAAATAAAAIGETRAVPVLLTILAEDERQDRKAPYINALGELGDRSAVPSLSTMLADTERVELSIAAAEALGKLGGDQARDALLAALRTHPGPQVRGAAAAALGVIKDPVAIAPLSDAVQFDDERVQRPAAKSIAQIGTKQAFDALMAIYAPAGNKWDAARLERAAAIRDALCESDAPLALDVLYDLLRNDLIPDPKAQLEAALALADKKDPRAAEFLNKLRGNKNTRIESERALSEIEGTAPEKPKSSAQPTPEADPAAETSHSEHFLQFRLVLDDADAEGKPRFPAPSKEDPDGTVALADEVWLSEDDIADAIARANNDTGQPEIAFTIEPEAGKKFYELTKDSKGKKMAIVFNGTVLSAPTISDGISTSGVITGSFTMDEAEKIAAAINHAARASADSALNGCLRIYHA